MLTILNVFHKGQYALNLMRWELSNGRCVLGERAPAGRVGALVDAGGLARKVHQNTQPVKKKILRKSKHLTIRHVCILRNRSSRGDEHFSAKRRLLRECTSTWRLTVFSLLYRRTRWEVLYRSRAGQALIPFAARHLRASRLS